MTLKEKFLYHQIHPLKLIADIGCEPVSLYFFWQRNLLLGLITHFVPPIAATLLLVGYVDLEAQKNSRVGVYIQRHMTRTIEGVRFAGDITMALGAWFHYSSLIIAGMVVVVLAWCSGLCRKAWKCNVVA